FAPGSQGAPLPGAETGKTRRPGSTFYRRPPSEEVSNEEVALSLSGLIEEITWIMKKSEMSAGDLDELFLRRDAVVGCSRDGWIGPGHFILGRDHHESGDPDVRRANARMIGSGCFRNDPCDPIFPSGPVPPAVFDEPPVCRYGGEQRRRAVLIERHHRERTGHGIGYADIALVEGVLDRGK